MNKTNKGFELDQFEKQRLNYEIKTHNVPEWILQSIHNTESLHTWTKQRYDAYLYKIKELNKDGIK